MRLRIGALAVLALAATASTQTAAYRLFGNTCVHTTVPPIPFRNIGLPRLGTTFLIETTPSLPPIGATNESFVLNGVSSMSFAGLALPFITEPWTRPGRLWCGTLYTSVELVVPVPVSTSPLVNVSFPVPAIPALAGLRVYQQVLRINITPFDVTLALSSAGEATLGL